MPNKHLVLKGLTGSAKVAMPLAHDFITVDY